MDVPSVDCCRTPQKWKRPEEVMRMHKLKMKKRALQSRLSSNVSTISDIPKTVATSSINSKNPFRLRENKSAKRLKLDEIPLDDTSTDGTLFRLLNFSQTSRASSQNESDTTFTNILSKLSKSTSSVPVEINVNKNRTELPIDWTLRTKVRLMSTKPFPWNQKLKTCEEASGITGFVRCIDTMASQDEQKLSYSLDTSANARFHQCCLVWQYPSIPWLDLYPRIGVKTTAVNNMSLLPVKDVMYSEWVQSFHSLFQLVRAKQCPYFYLMSNTFTCLFRAAGISSYSEINASITPTTRGFRRLLKEEDIVFTMPLRKSDDQSLNRSSMNNDDTGYESLDLANDFSDLNDDLEVEESDVKEYKEEDEDETEKWLQTMGVEAAEIKRFNNSQLDVTINREKQVDNTCESLVFVEGVEAQALFNFLMNCKSIIPTTGIFAGVPPTLVAPVAFTGSTLKSLKVRESTVKVENRCYHSMEIKGIILPNMVPNLCDLMRHSLLDKFSVTFANVDSTKAFSSATSHQIESSPGLSPTKSPLAPSVFGQQNLSDCGLKPSTLSEFCSNNVKQFDSIKFADTHFTYA